MDVYNHLLSRGLDPSKYPTSVRYDNERGVATFYLYTLSGRLAGYQTWNPFVDYGNGGTMYDQRYWTHVSRTDKYASDAPLFGAERFDVKRGVVYLVEGVFDAVALHRLGVNALAVLANDPRHLAGQFRAFGMETVGVLDGDVAGSKLAKYCKRTLVCPPELDPGDMTQEALAALLSAK